MRVSEIITALFLLAVLFGCATGSSIVTGKARPAISPSEVKIYLDPPLHLSRNAELISETKTDCFEWAIIPNHVLG